MSSSTSHSSVRAGTENTWFRNYLHSFGTCGSCAPRETFSERIPHCSHDLHRRSSLQFGPSHHSESFCSRLIGSFQRHLHPKPVSVTLFGNKVYANIIKDVETSVPWLRPSPACPYERRTGAKTQKRRQCEDKQDWSEALWSEDP